MPENFNSDVSFIRLSLCRYIWHPIAANDSDSPWLRHWRVFMTSLHDPRMTRPQSCLKQRLRLFNRNDVKDQ